MYVYRITEKSAMGKVFTTGFYNPLDEWIPDENFSSSVDAAARVNYLNGGVHAADLHTLSTILLEIRDTIGAK